ncbi:MAG: guanylate kinase, partial [Duodenibacillus sp.]|nr:guanylate kinase [Duodenibacillus sp.]
MQQPSRAGSLFIISAPSGAGKSSLVKALLARDPRIKRSVSSTTRAPRPGEMDGREYNFITTEAFEERVRRGEFLEHAYVHGNYYGTSRTWIEEQLAEGNDVLLEIDWQGASQVRRIFPEAASVFILPPTLEELASRLYKRGTDAGDVIIRRLAGAAREIAQAPNFDYVIVNDVFEESVQALQAITAAARLSYRSQAARRAE